MLGQLDDARDNLRRAFAKQFDEYQGQLVYRKLVKGAPIAITPDDRRRFMAEFEAFLPRMLWLLGGVPLALILGLVGVDESGLWPLPDWVPLVAVVGALPLAFFAFRRAMTAPARALAMRTPMGGERSDYEAGQTHLRAMTWPMFMPGLVIGGSILAIVGYAAFANRVIFTTHPWVMAGVTLFGGWLLVATLASMRSKSLAARLDGTKDHWNGRR